MKQLNLRLEDSLHAKLGRLAARGRRTLNAQVAWLIDQEPEDASGSPIYVEHQTMGMGVVTSYASADHAFIKFPSYSASRMCPWKSLKLHDPVNDDGVRYCGWTTEAGTFNGCGHTWPCPKVSEVEAVTPEYVLRESSRLPHPDLRKNLESQR